MFCKTCGTVLDVNGLCINCDKKQQDKNVNAERQNELKIDVTGWRKEMKYDPRFCSVCGKLLLKRDRSGFVLVIRCDQCNSLIHEKCYMDHHISCHNLIGIVIESENNKEFETFTEDLERTRGY